MPDAHEHEYPVTKESRANLPVTDFRDPIPAGVKEEIRLKDYLDVILRRKWLVIGILFFTFVSTLIFSLAAEKQYEARGSLEVNQGTQKITKFEDVLTDKLRYEEFIATQTSLLKSDTLAALVIARLNLAAHPVITGKKEKPADKGLMDRLKIFLFSTK